MGNKFTILKISPNAQEFSSVRLPTRCMTYTQRYFVQVVEIAFHSSALPFRIYFLNFFEPWEKNNAYGGGTKALTEILRTSTPFSF
jgi:hypothetical protein